MGMNKNFIKQCLAEFIGTFALVFAGCGAIIVHQLFPQELAGLAIPIVFGAVISVMIYAVGHISGAHFNPAVTIAFSLSRHFPPKKVVGYVLAQISGGLLASLLHWVFFSDINHGFGVTQTFLPSLYAVGFEAILTFFLMFVIISVATDTRAVGEMAGLAIGTTVMMCAFFGGPITGASMNPARSIAPAIVSGNFTGLWIYIVGPILGAAFGAIVYERIRCDDKVQRQGGCC